MKRAAAILMYAVNLTACLAAADNGFFAGALAGISTLSADGKNDLTGAQPASGSYAPENGPALNVFAGWHATGYLSLQGNYVRNTNDVSITRILGEASYEQARHSSQDAFVFDALLYFRNPRSWVRPYLSAGAGPVRFESRASGITSETGALPLPASEFSTTHVGFRVAVGIDLVSHSGWGFRYCFSETMSANPFSAQLSPQGKRRLANFQNLFGIVKYFGQ